MAKSKHRTVLFLCTGNYYRSRFAECLFNATASKMGLPWVATSRALALERGVNNVGPMAVSALEALHALNIRRDECTRMPIQAVASDFASAEWIVALKELEHRPLLQERFSDWVERTEYWAVDDALGVLPLIEREVMDLIARLFSGKKRTGPPPEPTGEANVKPAPPAKLKERPVVRVGRETKGRRGKGVTTVFDLPLKDAEIQQLATRLKERCGTGGTVKDGCIEIQGDQRERLTVELERLGYRVKRVGG